MEGNIEALIERARQKRALNIEGWILGICTIIVMAIFIGWIIAHLKSPKEAQMVMMVASPFIVGCALCAKWCEKIAKHWTQKWVPSGRQLKKFTEKG